MSTNLNYTFIYYDVVDYTNSNVLSSFTLSNTPLTFIPSFTTSTILSAAQNISNKTLRWDFGDGNFSTDIKPVHNYQWPGEYTVTLTVYDNNGNAYDSTYSTTVQIYNFISTQIAFQDYKSLIYDIPVGKLIDPLVLNTHFSWQDYSALSATGYTINLYASGAQGGYNYTANENMDKWSHLRALSRFYVLSTINGFTDYVTVESIQPTIQPIYVNIQNNQLQICQQTDPGSVLAGVTGSCQFWYTDDIPGNLLTNESPIIVFATIDNAKFNDAFTQRTNAFNFIDYPPYGFQNLDPAVFASIKTRYNPADHLSITTTGIDGEGNPVDHSFDIPYISWQDTDVPYVVKFKDNQNFTTKNYPALSSSVTVNSPICGNLQPYYDVQTGIVYSSGGNYFSAPGITFYEDFTSQAPQSLGAFYKGYFIASQSTENCILTASVNVIDPPYYVKDALINWITIPQYNTALRILRQENINGFNDSVTVTFSNTTNYTISANNVYAITVAPSGSTANSDYQTWFADPVGDKILKYDITGNLLQTYQLSAMVTLVNNQTSIVDYRYPYVNSLSAATPNDIALDSNNNLWVSLFDSGIVIKIDNATGYVTTVAAPTDVSNSFYTLSSNYSYTNLQFTLSSPGFTGASSTSSNTFLQPSGTYSYNSNASLYHSAGVWQLNGRAGDSTFPQFWYQQNIGDGVWYFVYQADSNPSDSDSPFTGVPGTAPYPWLASWTGVNSVVAPNQGYNFSLSGFAGEGLFLPASIDTDINNNLWVAYTHPDYSALIKYQGTNNFTTSATVFTLINFPGGISPEQIQIDRNSNVWVTAINHNSQGVGFNNRNDYLYKFDTNGNLLPGYPLSGFKQIGNLTIDGNQNAWVVQGAETLTKVDSISGTTSNYVAGRGNNITEYICSIGGITCDTSNNIWVINNFDSNLYILDANLASTGTLNPKYTLSLTYPTTGLPTLSSYTTPINVTNQQYSDGLKEFQAYGDWNGYNWLNKYAAPVSTIRNITGQSNVFNIYPSSGQYNIAKVNENWNAAGFYDSLRYQETLLDKQVFFDQFLGVIVGGLNAQPYELGKTVYEKIANFVDNNADINKVNIKSLLSFCQELTVDFEQYNLTLPPQLSRLVDLLSIKQSLLWGTSNKYALNFNPQGTTFSNSTYGINLSSNIDPYTGTFINGTPIVAQELFSGNYLLVNNNIIANYSNNSVIPLSAYSSSWGWGLVAADSVSGAQINNYYKFYNYNPVYNNTYYDNIINWSDPYTTLSQTNSSYANWSSNNGIVQTMLSYELTKGLRLFTSAANITYNS